MSASPNHPARTLTARAVEALKPPPTGRLEVAAGRPGLVLRVSDTGAKTWVLRYAAPDGRRARMSLGAFPSVSLEAARRAADAARVLLNAGRDPAHQRAEEKAEQRRLARTLGDVWDEYGKTRQGVRDSTRAYELWLWSTHLAPKLGALPLADLSRARLLAAVRAVGKQAPTTANRGFGLLRALLAWAMREGHVSGNPIAGEGLPFAEQSRERVLDEAELAAVWAALHDPPPGVGHVTACALRLALLTAQRVGAVATIRREHLDPVARTWTTPAAETKAGRSIVTPVSEAGWRALSDAWGADPATAQGFAFAGRAGEHVERASLSRAFLRLARSVGIENATAHDLRRSAASWIASERIGAPPHIVAELLGHRASSGATAVYLRHTYVQEKREALQAWATLLAELGSP